MKRRILSILLASAMILSACPVWAGAVERGLDNFRPANTYTQGQYADVPADNAFAENVKASYEYGLMQGYGTTFGIANDITRLASIIVACRINSIYETGANNIETTYSGTMQEKYLAYAQDHGIFCLFDDYSVSATRAEFAAILSSALPDEALGQQNTVDDGAIPDVQTADRFSDAIYRLYRAGVVVGSDAQGTFYPQARISRGAACAIVTRMVESGLRKSITLKNPNAPAEPEAPARKDDAFNYLCYLLYTYHNDPSDAPRIVRYGEAEEWALTYEDGVVCLTDWYESGDLYLFTTLYISQDLEPYRYEYQVCSTQDNSTLTIGVVEALSPYELVISEDARVNFSSYYSVYGQSRQTQDENLAAIQLILSVSYLDDLLQTAGDGYSVYDLGFSAF